MTPFGTDAQGRDVQALTLSTGDLTVRLLTLGAILQDVRLAGVDRNLTLGADRAEDYKDSLLYFGALVGPLVNRLGGAAAMIGDKEVRFEANQGGQHMLHSASVGTYGQIWQVVDHNASQATLAIDLPDGQGGFPGNRHVTVRFSVTGATLRMELTGTTDHITLMNFANHSYWNLDGGPTWAGHVLQVAADAYLPVDHDLIPTGEVRNVTGTDFDLRDGRKLVPGQPALDHNFCLSDRVQPLRDVLTLTGASGVSLTLATTEPGVQIYDGGHTRRPGKGIHEGIAIEAQRWPDAPHHPHFPSVILSPGQTYRQTTEWRFSRG